MNLKKVALILSLLMLLGIAGGNAHITKGTDNFTENQQINSQNDVSGQIDSVLLTKTINPNSAEYELSVNKRTTREFALAKTTIEIKVDSNPPRKFDVQNLKKIPTEDPFIFSYYIKTSMNQEIVNEIKNAKRVALRFELANGWQPVIVLREYVLNEWKEVINTEK